LSLGANLAVGLTGAAALGGAMALGWLLPGDAMAPSLALARHDRPADAGTLQRPGGDTASAAQRLAAALPGARPPPAVTVTVVRRPVRRAETMIAAAPPPPPPDPGVVFRSQTSAVVRLRDRSLAVLLAAGAGRPSRLLKVGDLFDDRWRLTTLTMNEAVLGDGVTQERVPLFGNAAMRAQ
jgi:hypothetical protein